MFLLLNCKEKQKTDYYSFQEARGNCLQVTFTVRNDEEQQKLLTAKKR